MPFCPKCRGEYMDWVKKCPDCHVPLVEKLEPEPKKIKREIHAEKLVTIATFPFPAAAHLAAAKLESEGIWSFVAGENFNSIYPVMEGGIMLQVREADAPKAITILHLDTTG